MYIIVFVNENKINCLYLYLQRAILINEVITYNKYYHI